jgi:hypothetical protein
LWEKELTSFEEKIVKEHLASCPECRREFEQFEKMMRWLHSVGEVEVPDEFLTELQKKMEQREGAIWGKKSRGRWFNFPLSLKLPVQAAAMLAIVFLVLYLTKMMPPMEGYRLKETEQTSSPLSVKEKSKQVLTRPAAPSPSSEGEVEKRGSGSTLSQPRPSDRGVERLTQKEEGGERRALGTFAETPRPKDVEQAKAPVPGEEKLEATTPQVKAETKRAEAPPPKTEVMAFQQIESKGAARAKVPSPEPGKIEKELLVKKKSVAATKPPQEIILRISDREKVISQLQELVKQFGGEMVTKEGNRVLASLPTGSFSEFEKELAGLSSTAQTDKMITKKHAVGSLRERQGVKGEEVGEKSKDPAKLVTEQESRIIVRILLVQE